VRNGEEYAHVYPLLTRLDSMKNNNNSNNYKVFALSVFPLSDFIFIHAYNMI
jgi:hypothetical protein